MSVLVHGNIVPIAEALGCEVSIVAILAAIETPATEPTEAQIKHMVDRFLQWRLPDNFSPDGGISFEPKFKEGSDGDYFRHEPVGTNLLDANQAAEMVRFMIDGLPEA